MIRNLYFYRNTHDICMKILDQLPSKWLKKCFFFSFIFMSWNGIKNSIAAQPNGLSYYFPIWSEWSLTVVRAHSLFFLLQSVKKNKNCKSSQWQINTEPDEKEERRASCTVAEQEIRCSHISLMKPLGSTICWHASMDSLPSPLFFFSGLFLADILGWKKSMSNIHRSHDCKWSHSNLWVNKLKSSADAPRPSPLNPSSPLPPPPHPPSHETWCSSLHFYACGLWLFSLQLRQTRTIILPCFTTDGFDFHHSNTLFPSRTANWYFERATNSKIRYFSWESFVSNISLNEGSW